MFTKSSSWQVKQSIPHITIVLYGDCVKMCEDFTPNNKTIGGCIATTRHLAHPITSGIFYRKQNDSRHQYTLIALLGLLRLFLLSRHFDAIEVIETEHPHTTRVPGCILYNGKISGNGSYARKRSGSRLILSSKTKALLKIIGPKLNRVHYAAVRSPTLVSDRTRAAGPRIMDQSYIHIVIPFHLISVPVHSANCVEIYAVACRIGLSSALLGLISTRTIVERGNVAYKLCPKQ
jgi:hypothetical protein